ncbi:MAG: adenine-specific methyltransferase EcoRI family protein [Synergistaceae bacterium]|nr:adenine-specific methyltransferase EcoRI family protein [Synergistaceae bacterium]
MPNKNVPLNAAARAKRDEFYTRLEDIERELRHYRAHFRGKVVLCNCDDPFESCFFKYFALNFDLLGLKKLIATSYASKARGRAGKAYRAIVTSVREAKGDSADALDVAELFRRRENELSELAGDGDFRSPECLALLDEADVVVTNPPFSLFREYVATLIEREKRFLIIGNQNAIKYKEIFPLIMAGRMWLGYGFPGNVAFFESPYEDRAVSSQHKEGLIRVSGVMWYTDLDIAKRHEPMILVARYSPDAYPKYDGYDAIEVSRTKDIPCGYPGIMGVPITFLTRYCPEQFEIVGELNHGCDNEHDLGRPVVGGVEKYPRILIRDRHPKV